MCFSTLQSSFAHKMPVSYCKWSLPVWFIYYILLFLFMSALLNRRRCFRDNGGAEKVCCCAARTTRQIEHFIPIASSHQSRMDNEAVCHVDYECCAVLPKTPFEACRMKKRKIENEKEAER